MAHKGRPASAKATTKKPTTKNKPKTTRKPAANAASAKRKSTSSSRSASAAKSKTRTTGTSSRKSSASKAAKPAEKNSAKVASSQTVIREPMDPKLKSDIILIVTLLVSLLLFISNLGIGGRVGRLFSSLFFGLFGAAAYTFPIILFLFVAFSIANKGNTRSLIKMIGFCFFFIFFCAFLHRITIGYQPDIKIASLYSNSAFDKSGGGFFGGIIVYGLGKAFGKLGCLITIIFGMILFACIMTQRALLSDMKEKSLHAKSRIRERSLQRSGSFSMDFDDYPEDELELFDEYDDFDDPDDFDEGLDDFYDHPEERPVRRRSERTVEVSESRFREKAKNRSDMKHSDMKNSDMKRSDMKHSETKRSEMRPEEKSSRTAKEQYHQRHLDELFDLKKLSEPMEEDGITNNSETINPDEIPVSADEYLNIEPAVADQAETEITMAFTGSGSSHAESAAIAAEDTAAAAAEPEMAAPPQEEPKRKKKNPRSSEAEIAINVEDISEQIEEKEQQIKEIPYQLPPLDLLKKGTGIPRGDSTKYLKETAATLEQVLRDFGVNVQITDVSCGPSVTRYELKPEQGVKVSKIVNLADDIKLNLAAANIRIEAPIPGKAAVGIEVPNKIVASVLLRDLLETPDFMNHSSKIAFAVGKDIAGKTVVTDIAKMPHLLIAGATGSGKSVCINTLIMSILYKASPDEVKLLMIDPKVVELSVYNGIPHLAIPVVTDPKKAAGALNWAVAEMSDRYNKFAEYGVRDVAGYNAKVDIVNQDPSIPEDQKPKRLPKIVIIVDELADLMMVAPGEVEDAICRLAQLARAAGIHLIIATQRPSVNVVTGLIKANMPSRIALSVASGVDSRTILDMNGAEKLLGHGDMLFYPQGYTKPARVQGGYVSDDEIAEVVKYLTEAHGEAEYDASIQDKINSSSAGGAQAAKGGGSDQDELFIDAAKLIIDKDKASIGMLQRAFKIGFNRAARIMDQLCEAGVVGEEEGTKPRKVLMSVEQFENYLEEGRL